MDRLIPAVNRVQDVLAKARITTDVDFPQIVVVGAQSSGKSSVLENVVGWDFLPRGSGIVTRRPLVVQLVHVNEQDARKRVSEGKASTWATFLHTQNKEFTDFKAVREEISTETNRLCHGKQVRPEEMRLTVYSPKVVDLTLVDLPGLTKVAVEGQQHDIAQQIEQVTLQWIRPARTIILAVTPANADIANSDAINIAKKVDPAGERTLAVLTKLDLMDKGTDALDVLMGRVIRLKRGFIGVVNRSQADIDEGKAIADSLGSEEAFFKKHEKYAPIADKMGTKHLVKTLNRELLAHLKHNLPSVRKKIEDLVAETRGLLAQLGEAGPEQTGLTKLYGLLQTYAANVCDVLDGKQPAILQQFDKDELVGGARIRAVFNDGFKAHLQMMDPFEGVEDTHIRAEIENCQGMRSALIIPDAAFDNIVRKQIANLFGPSRRCVDLVYEELRAICELSATSLSRYPVLRSRVSEFSVELLKEFRNPAVKYIEDFIKIEQAHINIEHPEFFGNGRLSLVAGWTNVRGEQLATDPSAAGHDQVAPEAARDGVPPGVQPQRPVMRPPPVARGVNLDWDKSIPQHISVEKLTDKEQDEIIFVKHLAKTYYDIVTKHVQDHVPKFIQYFIIKELKEKMMMRLLTEFWKEERVDTLMEESSDTVKRRAAAQKMHTALILALQELDAVRDFCV